MPKPFQHPFFWLAAFSIWFGVLWYLSSNTRAVSAMPPIPNFDKIAHFGYFLGGGGLLAAFFFTLRREKPRWGVIIALVVLSIGLIGWLDEIHQSHIPGRRGNDHFDWLADISGAFVGSLIFKRLHHVLR